MKSSVISEVVEASFSIYLDSDRKDVLSACQVTSLESLTAEEVPVAGGLYDLRMGPLDQRQMCGTCKSSYTLCPGHPGHIELDVPVYYPMYFGELVKILKTKCMSCHKLRVSSSRVRYYLLRLMLLEMGDTAAANSLFDLVAPSQLDKGDGEQGVSTEEVPVEKTLSDIELRFKRFCKSRSICTKPELLVKQMQREVIDSLMKLCQATKRCENCSAFSPPIRKDGAAKIFQKPIPLRQRKSMSSSIRLKSALHSIGRISRGIPENDDDGTDDEDLGDDLQSEAEEDAESGDGSDENDNRMVGQLSNAARRAPEADKYLPPLEVEAQIRLLWQRNGEILNFIWSRALNKSVRDIDLQTEDCWKIFFMRVVLVPPNRFRPMGKVGDTVSDHPQNAHLKKILEHNLKIRILQGEVGGQEAASQSDWGSDAISSPNPSAKGNQLSRLVSAWIDLQNAVNCYMDSAKDPNPLSTQNGPIGIRQLLERKEGLFRRHMMGKRVNYCCRSVISPDPYMGSNEIGIPVHFAKNLHYPTPVNSWNVKYLRTLVERGPDNYPGANQIELADGRIVKLDKLSAMERAGKAKLLLSNPGIKVYRHLVDGDVLLVNRQPTLHKPGIMAHKARVLKHVKEQTLRMNYANCNTYNADFDGDEMNCHFVQSELARAEAYHICNTDNQYIVPTSGNPLRGLIQDHVASAVKMTCKDTFLDRAEFQQLVYVAISGLAGTEIVTPSDDVQLPPPTIWKPKRLWTGKQVITALLSHLCRHPLTPLNLDSKARTPPTALGPEHGEHEVIIRNGHLLSGVLDKNAIGNVSLGVVHAVYELYGAELAGRLLNAFGRLFTFYLQNAGHSCGISDLVLTEKADQERQALLQQVSSDAAKGLDNFLASHVQSKALSSSAAAEADADALQRAKVAAFMNAERAGGKVKLDGAMQSVINQSASAVIKACLPNGLQVSFLHNNFSMMVLTGAKGSAVNQSQISCFLGQQALEGQRVPVMVSGKTLPSFKPFDGSARAGGFVRDRFLTGVKPQEYYFHCMAGREGLVDTAVKTSRSGYLQRCLVKHLEELTVAYDMTVRDSAGKVIQFLYGEDGLDPVHAGLLAGKPNQMLFLARNSQAFAFKYSLHEGFFDQNLQYQPAQHHHATMKAAAASSSSASSSGAEASSSSSLLSSLEKKAVLLARRKQRQDMDWSKTNLLADWHVAEITKLRLHEEKPLKSTVDIRYLSDQSVEKKVPLFLLVDPVQPLAAASSGNGSRLRIPLLKLGLPSDTAQSKLPLGNTVGAVSERMQSAIEKYISDNPDKVIHHDAAETASSTSSSSLSHTVPASSLELLIWIKYMRSLACPGEAVGCVAAQSVGEPSTQMTLNTFHLAGHGGANVTLGIPRLREIIMTASRALKTPTMLIPLAAGKSMDAAKALARKLSCLPLNTLLSHTGGVEVGEELIRGGPASRWERKYRVRLHFEAAHQIERAFGTTFDVVVATVKKQFLSKLDMLIKQEQRRAGESTAGKNDALKQFRSAARAGDELRASGRKGGDNEDEEEDEGRRRGGEDDLVADGGDAEEATGKTPSRRGASSDDSEDSASDEDSDQDDGSENGKVLRAVRGYGVHGDEEDDEDSGEDDEEREEDDDEVRAGGKARRHREDTRGEGEEESGRDEDTRPLRALGSTAKSDRLSKPVAGIPHTPRGTEKSSHRSEHKLVSFNEAEGWIEMALLFPAANRKILMAQLAERAAQTTMVRSTKNIRRAHAMEQDKQAAARGGSGWAVQTEGVNLEAVWALPDTLVSANAVQCNDIYQVLLHYGVEAARQSIVSEIQAVFGVYGIDVNPRHLSLIADFMTRAGDYTPMNRIGMMLCPSPLLQMSFETTCSFLTRAAQEGVTDNMRSASSRIVAGAVPKAGTGAFEVMIPLTQNEQQLQSYSDSVMHRSSLAASNMDLE